MKHSTASILLGKPTKPICAITDSTSLLTSLLTLGMAITLGNSLSGAPKTATSLEPCYQLFWGFQRSLQKGPLRKRRCRNEGFRKSESLSCRRLTSPQKLGNDTVMRAQDISSISRNDKESLKNWYTSVSQRHNDACTRLGMHYRLEAVTQTYLQTQ